MKCEVLNKTTVPEGLFFLSWNEEIVQNMPAIQKNYFNIQRKYNQIFDHQTRTYGKNPFVFHQKINH